MGIEQKATYTTLHFKYLYVLTFNNGDELAVTDEVKCKYTLWVSETSGHGPTSKIWAEGWQTLEREICERQPHSVKECEITNISLMDKISVYGVTAAGKLSELVGNKQDEVMSKAVGVVHDMKYYNANAGAFFKWIAHNKGDFTKTEDYIIIKS